MRHGRKVNHLGRTDSHRKAMLANMASSLIEHKRITTTLAKAKALRTYVEPLITKSKSDTTHSRRTVFSYLKSKDAVSILFREVSEKIANRPGGYTRIIKLENRPGDNSEMAMIELVDYNTVYKQEGKSEEKKTTRRGRSKTKKSDTPVAEKTVSAEAKPVEDKEVEAIATQEESAPEKVEETKAEAENETPANESQDEKKGE